MKYEDTSMVCVTLPLALFILSIQYFIDSAIILQPSPLMPNILAAPKTERGGESIQITKMSDFISSSQHQDIKPSNFDLKDHRQDHRPLPFHHTIMRNLIYYHPIPKIPIF